MRDKRYIFAQWRHFIVLDVHEGKDSSFSASYIQKEPEHRSYHGEFGPKGGYRNYAARRVVKELRKLPILKPDSKK